MGRPVQFEATLYNRDVRSYLTSGRRHPKLYAGWAYQNVVIVAARTLDEARSQIVRAYPESDGFVLMSIDPCHQYGWQRRPL